MQGCCYNQLTCVMQRIHCQCPVYYYVHMSLTVRSCLGVKPFQQQCDDIGGGVLTLGTPNSSCNYHLHTFELIPHILTIPILSPILFIRSLYASFLKFVGFFIYLSPLIFIYNLCKSLSGGQVPIKNTYRGSKFPALAGYLPLYVYILSNLPLTRFSPPTSR